MPANLPIHRRLWSRQLANPWLSYLLKTPCLRSEEPPSYKQIGAGKTQVLAVLMRASGIYLGHCILVRSFERSHYLSQTTYVELPAEGIGFDTCLYFSHPILNATAKEGSLSQISLLELQYVNISREKGQGGWFQNTPLKRSSATVSFQLQGDAGPEFSHMFLLVFAPTLKSPILLTCGVQGLGEEGWNGKK